MYICINIRNKPKTKGDNNQLKPKFLKMATQQSKTTQSSNIKITPGSRPCDFITPVASKPIQMEIVFGRPSKDCEDIGICRINFVTDLPETVKQQCIFDTKAIVYVQQKRNGQLLFRFPKNQLNQKTKTTQFANNQFTVPEVFILPAPLQQLFCPRLLIEAGTYQVIDNGKDLLIEM